MSWEERMSARARPSVLGQRSEQERRWAEADRGARQRRAEVRRVALREMAKMTLAEAIRYQQSPGIACACPGPPVCCWEYYQHAEQVVRAAHIAANLMLLAAEANPAVG